MHRRPFPSLAAALCVLALTIGGSACSGDDDGGGAAGASTTVAEPGADGSAAPPDGGGAEGGGGLDAPQEDLAIALATATSADDHVVEGSTIVLHFSTGSKDDPMATVNCSAASRLISEEDEVVLRYPDGTLVCAELDRTGDS